MYCCAQLNPGDNQGVRYLLLVLLLRLGSDAETARLLKRYDDDPGASWAFARALLAYRLGGDVPPARAELRKAIKTNRFVVEQLE